MERKEGMKEGNEKDRRRGGSFNREKEDREGSGREV